MRIDKTIWFKRTILVERIAQRELKQNQIQKKPEKTNTISAR